MHTRLGYYSCYTYTYTYAFKCMFNVLIVMILLTLDLYFIEKIKPKDNSLNRLVSAFYFKKQQDTPKRSKIIY